MCIRPQAPRQIERVISRLGMLAVEIGTVPADGDELVSEAQAEMECPEAAARDAANRAPAVCAIAPFHLTQQVEQDPVIADAVEAILVRERSTIGHQDDHGRRAILLDGYLQRIQEAQARPLTVVGVRAV